MGKRKKKPPRPPLPPSPKPPNLGGIALHDATFFFKMLFGALVVHWVFAGLFIPIVGPPHWFAQAFQTILFVITIVLGAAGAIDVLFSIFFHFRNRVRTRT